jgi:hypothetical protein
VFSTARAGAEVGIIVHGLARCPTPGCESEDTTFAVGVRVESGRSKTAPWSPLASKRRTAKSFILAQNVCNLLISLKWHGRGREFESHQVHQVPQRLTKTERAECVFWTPGVQKWTPATKVPQTLIAGSILLKTAKFLRGPLLPRKTRQTRQIGLNLLITLTKLMSGCSKKPDKSSRCHFSRCCALF